MKIISIFLLISLAFGTFQTFRYNNLENSLQEEIEKKDLIKQNYKAKLDSINMIPDSTQYYRVFVRDLEKEKQDLFKENKNIDNLRLLAVNKVNFLLDSISILENKTIVGGETSDSLITIPFNEKKGIVNISGQTSWRPKLKLKRIDYLNVNFDEFSATVSLSYDKSDSTITSLVSTQFGKVMGKTIISKELNRMIKFDLQKEKSFWEKLYVEGDIKSDNGLKYALNISYDFENIKPYVGISENFYFGVRFEKKISEIIKLFRR